MLVNDKILRQVYQSKVDISFAAKATLEVAIENQFEAQNWGGLVLAYFHIGDKERSRSFLS